MMILCSPHNPVGRVWRDELNKIGEPCLKYNVFWFDEITDIIYPNANIPLSAQFQKNLPKFLLLVLPFKTFNIPGLGISSVIIPNSKLSDIYNKTVSNLGMSMRFWTNNMRSI